MVVAIERIAGSLCLLAVGASAIYVANDLHQTQTEVRASISSLNTTIQSINQTVVDLNAPCVGFHGSVTCGPIAQLSQTEKNIGILAGQSALQVKQSATLVNTASTSLTTVANAVSETAHSASGTLQEAQTTIKGLQPLTEAATVSVQHLVPVEDSLVMDAKDFDAILKDDAIHRTLNDVAGMTDSGNHILFDFRRVADKTTEDYLKPVKWYMQPVKKFGDLWDIGAAVARHAP